MSGPEDFDAWQEAMLDGLSLLARLYWGPDRELCDELSGEPVLELLAELTGLLPEAGPSLRSLSLYLAGQTSPAALCAELTAAYEALFLGQGGPPPAPLHHSCYVGDGRLMGPPAANMAARLEAEDLALEERPGEPPDHLAVEIEYLAYLLEEAWSHGRPGGETEAAGFAGRFMLPWARECAARQERASASPVFPLAGKLLTAILQDLAA